MSDDAVSAGFRATSAEEIRSWEAKLESCRPYLMAIAAREIRGSLRVKCGLSDLVQETLLEAHKQMAAHGTAPVALKPWLRGALRRKAIDWARKYRTSVKRDLGRERSLNAAGNAPRLVRAFADPEPTPSTRAAANEEHRLLDAAIELLPPDERAVILYHSRDRLSWEEVGSRLNRSPEAARKLWSRAVERLQTRLRGLVSNQ